MDNKKLTFSVCCFMVSLVCKFFISRTLMKTLEQQLELEAQKQAIEQRMARFK